MRKQSQHRQSNSPNSGTPVNPLHQASRSQLEFPVIDLEDHWDTIQAFREGPPFLRRPNERDRNKLCLVLDLDETLVHSGFLPVMNPSLVVNSMIGGFPQKIFVLKRPYVDQFLNIVSDLYECILFTASLSVYADPVVSHLDPNGTIFRGRFYREHCLQLGQVYIKDLARLGRPLSRVAIIDNSPTAYMLQPDNAIPISSWFDNLRDTELLEMIPFLKKFARVDDVPKFMKRAAARSVR